jgi:hypothetical protein
MLLNIGWLWEHPQNSESSLTFTLRWKSMAVMLTQYLSGIPDYYDFELDAHGPGIPTSYGGFSGGGLWRLLVCSSPLTGKVDWAYRLKGVMFWEFEPVNNRRVIRCHGQETITSLLKVVREQAQEEGGSKS